MRDLAADLGYKGLELLSRIVARHWSKSRAAWVSAFNEPAPGLRLLYLAFGLLIAFYLIPPAFRELGVMGGISYLVLCSVQFQMQRSSELPKSVEPTTSLWDW